MFKDLNLKLAVISELHNQGIYLEEVEEIFDKHHDESDYSYKPIPAVLKFYKNLKLEAAQLDLIEELRPDGGDHAYMFLMNNWDGEDNQFDIKDLSGIEFLNNLKIFDPIAMISDEIRSVAPLLGCKQLEFIDLDLFAGVEDCKEVAQKLSERGVDVNLTDAGAQSELNHQIISFIKEADTFFENKEYENAIQCYLNIAKLTPEDADIYNNIAALYEELNNELKVIEYLKLYHTYSEGDADSWFRQAALCDNNGLKDDAYNGYLEALKLDDKYGDVYNALGYHLIEKGEPLAAIPYLKKAIEHNEEDYAQMNLGHVYMTQGDQDKALEHYRISFKKYLMKSDFMSDFEDDFELLSKFNVSRISFEEVKEKAMR